MAKKNKVQTDTILNPDVDMDKAGKMLIFMATIMNNTIKDYWLSDSDAKVAVDEGFHIVEDLMRNCNRVAIRIINNAIMINGNRLEEKNPLLNMFVDHISSFKADNFDITEGVTENDFHKFIEILSAQPQEIEKLGGFVEVMEQFNLKTIFTKKMIYREIQEQEVVVSKRELQKQGGSRASGGGSDEEGDSAGSILAFLKGDISAEDKGVSESIKEIASDPEKMAELILQAADVREKAADVESGESLIDFVVGCLRRTYEGASKTDVFKTQKGKKKLTKDLILLEEEVLNRMRDISDAWTEEELGAISDATDEITDEIKMDTMADEYMTKLNASYASEQKVLDFINSEGLDEASNAKLQQKLADRGLGMTGWRELVIKNSSGETAGGFGGSGGSEGGGFGGPGGGAGFGNIMDAITHLNTLLDNMEKEFEKSKETSSEDDTQKLLDVLKGVNLDVKALTEKTTKKIHDLIKNLKMDENTVFTVEKKLQDSGEELVLTRDHMLNIISEIVQDIGEPLELIKSSLDMATSKVFTGNIEQQLNAIKIAAQNTHTIKGLLNNLGSISSGPAVSE